MAARKGCKYTKAQQSQYLSGNKANELRYGNQLAELVCFIISNIEWKGDGQYKAEMGHKGVNIECGAKWLSRNDPRQQ